MKGKAGRLDPLKGQIQFIRHLAKCYNVRLSVRKRVSAFGIFDPRTHTILLRRDKEILTTFFHELGHLQAMKAGVYKKYYQFDWERLPIEYIYKAECDADRRGKRLMGAFFPDLKYYAWYIKNPATSKKWLKNWFNLY